MYKLVQKILRSVRYSKFRPVKGGGILTTTLPLEFELNTANLVTKNFKWNSSLNVSLNRNKITSLGTDNSDIRIGQGKTIIQRVGHPVNSYMLLRAERTLRADDFESDGVTPKKGIAIYTGQKPGDTKWTDINDDGKITSADYDVVGSYQPKFEWGFTNTFKYKNWEFSCFVTMQAGNKIRMNPSFDPAFADLNVFSKEYYNRWLNPGDERKTNIPVIPSQDLIRNIGKENIEKAYNTYNYSQNRVADGSFVRMKNISLGYRLPQRFLSHLKIKQMNVKVNVTNPFLIYSDRKLNGQDPEFYRSGGVSLPTPKQYTMTFNVEF